MHLGIGI